MRYEERHIMCREQGHVFTDTDGNEWRSGDLGFKDDGSVVQLVHWCDVKLLPWIWEQMSDKYLQYAGQTKVHKF